MSESFHAKHRKNRGEIIAGMKRLAAKSGPIPASEVLEELGIELGEGQEPPTETVDPKVLGEVADQLEQGQVPDASFWPWIQSIAEAL